MAEPTLPETISPERTGPSSLVMERATTVPTNVSAPNLLNPVWLWSDKTIPVNAPVIIITGMEFTPTSSIWVRIFFRFKGRRNVQRRVLKNIIVSFPPSSTSFKTFLPIISNKRNINYLRFIYPSHPSPNGTEYFIGDCPCNRCQLLNPNFLPPLFSQKNHNITNLNYCQISNIYHTNNIQIF